MAETPNGIRRKQIMKWLKSLVELFRDVLSFIKVRNEQRHKYEPILEDFEILETLNKALKERIGIIAQKINLFPQLEGLVKNYNEYLVRTEQQYSATRIEVLNNLLSAKDKPTIGNMQSNPFVNRRSRDISCRWRRISWR